jgi:hypothetical protein
MVNIPLHYTLLGVLLVFLLLHFLWCRYVAFPTALERQLKRGKPWVYIPLRWKGMHKLRALFFSRLLVLGITAAGTALLLHLTGKRETLWVAGMASALLIVGARLDAFWTHLRYRQQEDAYYQLHDALRARLESEGKDYTEAQFRNLTSYQHQQRLRKADEAGKLMSAMRRDLKAAGTVEPRPEPVES